MSEQTNQDPIVYRFTPPFDGAHLRGVPQRDLTQQDVDRMTASDRRDAFTPHPGFGTPLFTAVTEEAVEQQALFAAAAIAPDPVDTAIEFVPVLGFVEGNTLPRWFVDRQERAEPGTLLPLPVDGETQRQYDARIARFAPDDNAGNKGGDA